MSLYNGTGLPHSAKLPVQARVACTAKVKLEIKTFIEYINEETDTVEIKVQLKNVITLQRIIDELRSNCNAIPNVKDVNLDYIDEELKLIEECLEKLKKKRNIQVYHLNQVNVGVSSKVFLAASIRHYIEKDTYGFSDTVEILDRRFYADDLIFLCNELEEL
ncbi:hypothetical protein TNCV_4986301 [Trichonephila clavipes]|nr:hypothetical protein TNCV_4986301 [Trichonephila clavipes]